MAVAMAKRISGSAVKTAKARLAKHYTQTEQPKRIKPPTVLDDVYFHKSQVEVGKRLISYSRWDPLTEWEVVDIRSNHLGKTVGQIVVKKVSAIRRLQDVLTLRNLKTNEIKKLSFQYMSFSAVWRLKSAN